MVLIGFLINKVAAARRRASKVTAAALKLPILGHILIVGSMGNPCYWDKVCSCDRKLRSFVEIPRLMEILIIGYWNYWL